MKFGRESGDELHSHNAFDAHATNDDDDDDVLPLLLLLFDEAEHGSIGHRSNGRHFVPSLECPSPSQHPQVDGKPGQELALELFSIHPIGACAAA